MKALIAVGLLLWIVSGILVLREWNFLKGSTLYHGKVVDLIETPSSKGGSTYKPKISYTDKFGARQTYTRGFSSNPAGLVRNEKVIIAVHNKDNIVRIATFGHRFGTSTVLLSIGLSIFCFIVIYFTGSQFLWRMLPIPR